MKKITLGILHCLDYISLYQKTKKNYLTKKDRIMGLKIVISVNYFFFTMNGDSDGLRKAFIDNQISMFWLKKAVT